MAEKLIEVDHMEDALALFGSCDENMRIVEKAFGVTAVCRGTEIKLSGEEENVQAAVRAVDAMLQLLAGGTPLEEQAIHYCISLAGSGDEARVRELTGDFVAITAKGKPIRPKTLGQKGYIRAITQNSITFGIGPAGTGKTYLAVAMAVKAFKAHEVSRIILTRPAVEAGEKLGFLPGDLQNKVDPYLRPLYDALFDMLGAETYQKLMEKQLIEVAPLAYMRVHHSGRGTEHQSGTDENVSHTHGHGFQSGCDGRYHADRPARQSALRACGCDPRSEERGRDRIHSFQ